MSRRLPAERMAIPRPTHCLLFTLIIAGVGAATGSAPRRAVAPRPAPPEPYLVARHGPADEVRWSPDGKTLATIGWYEVVLWDARTGLPRPPLVRRGSPARFPIRYPAWSPDGKFLAAWAGTGNEGEGESGEGALSVWDAATGIEQRRLAGSWGPFAWSPDGQTIAAFLPDLSSGGALIDARTLKVRRQLQPQKEWFESCLELAWNADGTALAGRGEPVGSGADATANRREEVAFWDVRSGKLTAQRPCASGNMTWSPDGRALALATDSDTVTVWDARGIRRLAEHSFPKLPSRYAALPVQALAWRPHGKALAICAPWRRAVLWEPFAGGEHSALRAPSPLAPDAPPGRSVAWSNDGRYVAIGDDRETAVCDVMARRVVGTRMISAWSAVAWSPRANLLAVPGTSEEAALWRPDLQRPVVRLQGHLDDVHRLAWRPNGTMLVTDAGQPPAAPVVFWYLRSGSLRGVPGTLKHYSERSDWFSGPPTHQLAWSPDGSRLAFSSVLQHFPSGSYPGPAGIWTVPRDGIRGLTGSILPAAEGPIQWSATGRLLAYGAQLWNSDGTLRCALPGAAGACSWSPDGRLLATGAETGPLLWEPERGTRRALNGSITYPDHIAWSRDGARISASSDQTVEVWDSASGRSIATLSSHTARITSLVWAPRSDRFATAAAHHGAFDHEDDHTAILWDGRAGRKIATLACHNGTVNDLAWNARGDLLATIAGGTWFSGVDSGGFSAAGDRNVILWDGVTGERRRVLRGHRAPVVKLAWSPDGETLATGGTEPAVILWNPATGAARAHIRLPGWGGQSAWWPAADQLVWRPDGKLLAAISGGAVLLFDRAGTPRLTLYSLDGGTNWLAVAADGHFTGSPGALRAVQWRVGGRLVPTERIRREWERPGLAY